MKRKGQLLFMQFIPIFETQMAIIKHLRNIKKIILLLGVLLLLGNSQLTGQSHNYWTRSFNEESSLLSGAVTGGGAGPSAIYFNPSSIAEISESKFSLHASLFKFDFINVKNAIGTDKNLSSSKISIAPRFLSYMIQPKKHPEWSFEIAFLNNEDYSMDFTENVDFNTDVLTHLPGVERYFATFQYSNHFRDDWIGIGGSWKLNKHLYLGASLFISVQSLSYRYATDIEAFPLNDSIVVDGEIVPFYAANYQKLEYVKFNDYRLLGKLGMMYRKNKISFGASITTPSTGVYSDGKKVTRKLKQSNITDPETGEPIPDFVVVDFQEKKNMMVNSKRPFAVAVGFNYTFSERKGTLYSSLEYFNSLDPYRIVEANENPSLTSGTEFESIEFNEWLTFVSGAEPVLNLALGYKAQLREDLVLMTGFRTDFNYKKDLGYSDYLTSGEIKGLDVDLYHLTGGLTLTILGQDLIAGLQYTIGRDLSQKQLINLSNPIEYNRREGAALQGDRSNSMRIFVNSVSLYFGATFNFGTAKNKEI